MAIVSKLPVDSILWKYVQIEKRYRTEPDNRYRYVRDEHGHYIQDDVEVYYYISLYTRRARTNGCVIEEKLVPFFEKIKVRIDRGIRGRQKPVAVGCQIKQCRDKEEWDNLVLHEVAQKYYNRVKNADILKVIQKQQKIVKTDVIEELKTLDLTQKPEPEEWPEEPMFHDETPWWVREGHF